MTRRNPWQTLAVCSLLGSALGLAACDSGPSISESLDQKAQEEKFEMHVRSAREGAAGIATTAGGGCGCN